MSKIAKVFVKNLFHNPIFNEKWVGPHGHMEVIFNKKTKKVVTDNLTKGTFNLFGPDQEEAHTNADVIPWVWRGN